MRWPPSGGRTGRARNFRKGEAMQYKVIVAALKPNVTDDVVDAAKACGISFNTIKDYNPQLRGYYLGRGAATLLVPEGTHKDFQKKFAALYKTLPQKKRSSGKYHLVKSGENLSIIAGKYQISLYKLLQLNKLSKRHVIHPGDKLRVR